MRTGYHHTVWIILLLYINVFSGIMTFNKGGTGSGYILVNGVKKILPYSDSYPDMSAIVVEAVPEIYWITEPYSSYFKNWTGPKSLFSSTRMVMVIGRRICCISELRVGVTVTIKSIINSPIRANTFYM